MKRIKVLIIAIALIVFFGTFLTNPRYNVKALVGPTPTPVLQCKKLNKTDCDKCPSCINPPDGSPGNCKWQSLTSECFCGFPIPPRCNDDSGCEECQICCPYEPGKPCYSCLTGSRNCSDYTKCHPGLTCIPLTDTNGDGKINYGDNCPPDYPNRHVTGCYGLNTVHCCCRFGGTPPPTPTPTPYSTTRWNDSNTNSNFNTKSVFSY